MIYYCLPSREESHDVSRTIQVKVCLHWDLKVLDLWLRLKNSDCLFVNWLSWPIFHKTRAFKSQCKRTFTRDEWATLLTPYGLQTPSNLWPWHIIHDTNVTSLPVSLTTHHAVWSWQGGHICIVYGVPGSKVARCLHALRRHLESVDGKWGRKYIVNAGVFQYISKLGITDTN